MIPEWMDQYVSMAALNITWSDVVEILILAFIIYHVMIWIKSTRAWSLMKGSAVLFALLILAYVFHMNTILWIAKNCSSPECFCIRRYSAGTIRNRKHQLCSCSPDHHGYRCRCCMSGTALFHRNQP